MERKGKGERKKRREKEERQKRRERREKEEERNEERKKRREIEEENIQMRLEGKMEAERNQENKLRQSKKSKQEKRKNTLYIYTVYKKKGIQIFREGKNKGKKKEIIKRTTRGIECSWCTTPIMPNLAPRRGLIKSNDVYWKI